jgi:ketosteroid isomerase-like protein
MKHVLKGLAIAILAAGSVYAQSKPEDAVLAAQKKFVDAYRTCNVAEMNTIVTDDMQFIHVGGNTQDKAQFVAGIGTCSLADLRIDVSKVRIYGDAAIIQGMFNYKPKQGAGGTLVISEVFVKKNGAWQFASHQSTLPAAPRPASN